MQAQENKGGGAPAPGATVVSTPMIVKDNFLANRNKTVGVSRYQCILYLQYFLQCSLFTARPQPLTSTLVHVCILLAVHLLNLSFFFTSSGFCCT